MTSVKINYRGTEKTIDVKLLLYYLSYDKIDYASFATLNNMMQFVEEVYPEVNTRKFTDNFEEKINELVQRYDELNMSGKELTVYCAVIAGEISITLFYNSIYAQLAKEKLRLETANKGFIGKIQCTDWNYKKISENSWLLEYAFNDTATNPKLYDIILYDNRFIVETNSGNFNVVVGNYQLKYCGKTIKKEQL